MLLPKELVHIVFSFLAYQLKPRENCEPPEIQLTRVSSDILSLSLVNQRLRRIGSPFVFECLRITCLDDAKRLYEYCSRKTLILESLFHNRDDEIELLCKSFPLMKQLSCVDIRVECIALISPLNKHHRVSTILFTSIYELPVGSALFDLSKVVLKEVALGHPSWSALAPRLARGMKVLQLVVRQPELITDEFALRNFRGLCELDLVLGHLPIPMSWFPKFTSAHPSLKKIRFIGDSEGFLNRHTLSFLASFEEDVRNKQLSDACWITHLSISRLTSSSKWLVTGLTIDIKSSLIEILSLLQSSFPTILTLTLKFEENRQGRQQQPYHIDSAVTMFSLFSSLEVLSFHFSFGQLHGQAHQPEARTSVDAVEAEMLWYISRIVQHIPSLQALYINEEGYDDEKHNPGHHWSVNGWLDVVSKSDGTREMVGTLRRL